MTNISSKITPITVPVLILAHVSNPTVSAIGSPANETPITRLRLLSRYFPSSLPIKISEILKKLLETHI